MTLHIKTVNQSLSITPQPQGLEFSQATPEQVDVTLKATIGAMVKISRHGMENADLEPGELEIQGDPIIGQRFAQVITSLDIDWQGLLAEQMGDGPAQIISVAGGQAKEFAQTSQTHLKDSLTKFIKQDMNIVVDKTEVDAFLDDVDTLRADADRLIARIKRLQR